MVGQYSSRAVPCVGVSLGVERLFVILERKALRKADELGASIKKSKSQVSASFAPFDCKTSANWYSGVAARLTISAMKAWIFSNSRHRVCCCLGLFKISSCVRVSCYGSQETAKICAHDKMNSLACCA